MKFLSVARLAAAIFCLGVAFVGTSLHARVLEQMPAPDLTIRSTYSDLPDAPMMQTSTQPPASGASITPGSNSTSTPASSSQSQQVGQTAADSAKDDTKQQQKDQAARDVKAEEKQRLLGIMPQFQLVQGGQAPPLTAGQKFDLALHSAIDPFYIGWAFVVGGGWGEVVDSNKGYGWGDEGYFKRVGANYADNVDGALIGNALLPVILRQDPRYFRVGTGSFGHRFLSAALSTVVCRGDNGKKEANVSNVLGNFIAGGLSNLYYPKDERGALLTVENGISVTLFGALGGQFLEFGPDINRLVHRKKRAAAGTPPSSGGGAGASGAAPIGSAQPANPQ